MASACAVAQVPYSPPAPFGGLVPYTPPTATTAPAAPGVGPSVTPVQPPSATATAGVKPPPLQFSLRTDIEVTDNVDLAPSATRRGDVVFRITPELAINNKTAHTALAGTVTLPVLLYARTGSENNSVRPEVDLRGTAELLPRFFYIDGAAQVSQQYFSPFGARPQNVSSATQNRYTAQSYSVAPYIKGLGPGGLSYELRDNNIWTDESSAPTTTGRSYTNDISANLLSEPRPLGYALEYRRTDTRFSGQEPLLTEIERARAIWRPDPLWELSAIAGYENNEFAFENQSGIVYGASVRWHPSRRTTVDTSWEHRFFGGSYHVSLGHRTPFTIWSLRASRDITTYPEQLGVLGSGTSVSTLLNQLFASRITDPLERQGVVDQLISNRGLPSVLSNPLALFTQGVTLQESVQATAGVIRARNSVLVTAYRQRNEPIGGATGTPVEVLLAQNNNTQNGVNVVWSYKLTPRQTLTANADWVHTISNETDGEHSNQGTLYVVLSTTLSPLTSLYAGARYQRLFSTIQTGYHEAAAFVGIGHTFR